MAPLAPFMAEELYQNLVCSVDSTAPDSVHLAQFPVAEQSLIDQQLMDATRLAMRRAVLALGAWDGEGRRLVGDALALMAEGRSRAQVAHKLKISESTLRVYLDSARHKLGGLNAVHAVALAVKSGAVKI